MRLLPSALLARGQRSAPPSVVVNATAVRLREAVTAAGGAHASPRRRPLTYDDVAKLVCDATGWPVGHAWARVAGHWRSSGAWYDAGPDRGQRLLELRSVTAAMDLGSGRGLVAAVLHLGACRFMPDLSSLGSETRRRLAEDLGLTAVVGVPVAVGGHIAAVFEFMAQAPVEADGDIAEALLAAVALGRRQAGDAPAAPAASAAPAPRGALDIGRSRDLRVPDPLAAELAG